MSSQFISPVRIELVSDPTDVPALASVFDIAILSPGDNFRELLKRYVEDPYTEVERHLRSALSPAAEASTQQHFVLKAVWPGDDDRQMTFGTRNPSHPSVSPGRSGQYGKPTLITTVKGYKAATRSAY